MKKWILVLMSVLASSTLYAGNGSSGGGNIFGDQLNPWFINNTTNVKYCVEIADDFSDLSRQKILDLITDAFSFWKSSFEKYSSNYLSELNEAGIYITLGTQSFIYQEQCDSNTDITFLMGVLSEEQKKIIPYKQLIGLARRTSYDAQNLRAKGFIYIAPEKGALRPQSPKMHAKPWSYGKNAGLKYTLYHEIGHIFGLQDDHYGSVVLMDAQFVSDITTKETIPFLNSKSHPMIPSPFGCNKFFDGETTFDVDTNEHNADNLRKYLGLSTSYKLKLKSVSSVLSITEMKNNKIIGEVRYNEFKGASPIGDTAIAIYLSRAQKVFSKVPRRLYNNVQPLYEVIKSSKLPDQTLKLANGNELKVFVNFDSSCAPEIGAVFEDKVYFDIFFE